MVGLDSWADDEGLGELVIPLEPGSVIDTMEILAKGEILTVDEEVTFLVLVGCGDEEIIVTLDSPGC